MLQENFPFLNMPPAFGGVESLIEHRRSTEGKHPVSPENLLRISIGIKNVEDLKEDFKTALG